MSETEKVKLSYYERNREYLLNKQKEYNRLHYKENTERNKKYYNKEYYRLYYHSHISPKRLNQNQTQSS